MGEKVQETIPPESKENSNKEILEFLYKVLEDSNLTEEEKTKLQKKLQKIGKTTIYKLLDTKEEIINYIEQSEEYKKILENISSVSGEKIKEFQKFLKIKETGNFDVYTFIKYKNSILKDIPIIYIINGKNIKTKEDIKEENINLLKTYMNGNSILEEKKEAYYNFIDLKKGDFVSYNLKEGYILIASEDGVIRGFGISDLKKEIEQKFEGEKTENEELENLIVEKNIKGLELYIQKNGIENLRKTILEKNLFSNMREMFLEEKEDLFILKKDVAKILKKNLIAFDLFGDFQKIKVNGIEYTAFGEEFIELKNGKNKKQILKIFLRKKQQVKLIEERKDLEILNNYPELARKLGRDVTNKYLQNAGGNCAKAVGDISEENGIEITRGNAKDWEKSLNNRAEKGQFIKVEVNHPSEALPGAYIVYRGNALYGTELRKKFGHIEIKGADGLYYYDGFTNISAGSSLKFFKSFLENFLQKNNTNSIEIQIFKEEIQELKDNKEKITLLKLEKILKNYPEIYKKITGFTGYVYYPVKEK